MKQGIAPKDTLFHFFFSHSVSELFRSVLCAQLLTRFLAKLFTENTMVSIDTGVTKVVFETTLIIIVYRLICLITQFSKLASIIRVSNTNPDHLSFPFVSDPTPILKFKILGFSYLFCCKSGLLSKLLSL